MNTQKKTASSFAVFFRYLTIIFFGLRKGYKLKIFFICDTLVVKHSGDENT